MSALSKKYQQWFMVLTLSAMPAAALLGSKPSGLIQWLSLSWLACAFLSFVVVLVNQKKQKELERDEAMIGMLHADAANSRTHELEDEKNTMQSLNDSLRQKVTGLNFVHSSLKEQNQRTEEALMELSDIYNYSPCGYHSTNDEGLIIRINETELSWLGYGRDEIVGKKKFVDLLDPEMSGSIPAIFEDFKFKGVVKECEFELIKKDGSKLPVMINASAIYDDHGKFLMSRSVVFDLTDRKKMEKQVQTATEKMGQVMADKNNFLAMASHDLKSPLNSMLGLLNLFRADSINLSPDQRENVEFIFTAGINMKAMIDKLLDLNRIEQGKSMVQKIKFDLLPILKKIISNMSVLAERKNIQIALVHTPAVMPMISDTTLISQILENLISNAVKFSHRGKKVTVTARLDGQRVAIEVADEGLGIKPEEYHKVFGKFQKLSARPTGGETSTGLGLSIVKQLIATLDGKVTFKSEAGVGTVFSVELPVS